jgi:hypothetical protein
LQNITTASPPKQRPALWAALALALVFTAFAPKAAAEDAGAPLPDFLQKRGLAAAEGLLAQADCFLNIPYRTDGALHQSGRFTRFSRPDKVFSRPGLNCSGLVAAMSRYLLGRDTPLEQAVVDRLGDSGPDAGDRRDWDFGYDLILNLTDGFDRYHLTPRGPRPWPEGASGENLRGVSAADGPDLKRLLDFISPGWVYLASFSKPAAIDADGVKHYHVGLFLADDQGGVWFYNTTHNAGKSYRVNLRTPRGLSRFTRAFGRSRVLVIGVRP